MKKVAFVAGFFTPVYEALEERFGDQLAARSLVWIGQRGPHGPVHLKRFRETLNDSLARGVSEVLVLLAVLRGKEYVIPAVSGIVAEARGRWPAQVRVESIPDAGAKERIVNEILAFGIEPPSKAVGISAHLLHAVLGQGRVLCVRETNHTSFQQGFSRVGLPPDTWCAYFDEEAFDAGRLSNLPSCLLLKSASYRCILYAWHGLRHLPGKSKLRCPVFQAGNVTEAIGRFKKWLLTRAQ